jgi:Phosphotransferase enzyme family
MTSQTLFPLADTVERYLVIRGDDARLRPAVMALCDRLGLRVVDIVRFADSSLPVYAVGDTRVLKLYPGAYQHSYQVERRVLQTIQGRLPIPTPGVEHAGKFEGWNYLLIERLQGQPVTTAWEHLSAAHATGWPPSSAKHWRRCMPPRPRNWTRFSRLIGSCSWHSNAPAVSTVSAHLASTAPGWRRSRPSWMPSSWTRRRVRSCCTPRSCASTCW